MRLASPGCSPAGRGDAGIRSFGKDLSKGLCDMLCIFAGQVVKTSSLVPSPQSSLAHSAKPTCL